MILSKQQVDVNDGVQLRTFYESLRGSTIPIQTVVSAWINRLLITRARLPYARSALV